MQLCLGVICFIQSTISHNERTKSHNKSKQVQKSHNKRTIGHDKKGSAGNRAGHNKPTKSHKKQSEAIASDCHTLR